jgi:signal transduction histidine kinase
MPFGVKVKLSRDDAGLGLSMVRDLAQLSGGTIRLDQSTLGSLKPILTLAAQA